MRKTFGIFILIILLLHFYNDLIPSTYAQSLVFGPEFFAHEIGTSQQAAKSFSVQDVNQKFMLSIQSGGGREHEISSCTIDINGAIIVLPDECGKPFNMLTKPVKLQKQNDISVKVTGETDTLIVVAIMNMEDHAVTAKIPPIGKLVSLAGYASILFPADTFDSVQSVTVSATSSASTNDIFEAYATWPYLPYEIRINTGNKAPGKGIEIDLNIPDSFYSSQYQIHIFARMHNNPEEPEKHDRFFMISSSVDEVIKTVRTTLPKHAFSTLYSKNGTYEAVITVGLIE